MAVLAGAISNVSAADLNVTDNSASDVMTDGFNENSLEIAPTDDDSLGGDELKNSSVSFDKSVISYDYGKTGSVSVDVDGGTIGITNIIVTGHPEATIVMEENSIFISNLDAGNYTLNVATTPDDFHKAVSSSIAINVNKVNSSIVFKDSFAFKEGQNGSSAFIVEGGSLDYTGVSVVGYDAAIIAIENNVLTVSGLPAGNYKLKVLTTPDKNHVAVESYADIVVTGNAANSSEVVSEQVNSAKITVKTATVAYKKSTNWPITVKDSNGKAVSGAKVTLKIYKGNKLYKTVTGLKTNSNGVVNYKTSSLPVGTFKIVVSASKAGYTIKAATSSIKVIKPTPLKIVVNTNSHAKGVVISIIVMNNARKLLNNVKITLNIKNGNSYKTIKLVTGKFKGNNGVCAYATNMLTTGKHKVTVAPTDVKYSGSVSKTVTLKSSAKKYGNWWQKISKGKMTTYE